MEEYRMKINVVKNEVMRSSSIEKMAIMISARKVQIEKFGYLGR